MLSRREFLSKGCLGAVGLAAAAAGYLDFPVPATAQNGDVTLGAPLRERAAAKGLFYGAACSRGLLAGDSRYADVFARECGIMVPESDLKWQALRPAPEVFNFADFDWLMEYAQSHKMLFRGHNLVWHEALPHWFSQHANAGNAQQLMSQHISAVVSRHAGKVHSWDVVNEPVALWDRDPEGLRTSSPWHRLLGPGYIEEAFRAAAQADPAALLVLNQNRIEQERPGDDGTRKAVLRLLRRLKSAGTPLHALGIESHLGQPDAQFNPRKFRQFLADVADLGLKIIITELDFVDKSLPADVATRDRLLAGMYQDFIGVALEEKAVLGVLTWGLSDRYSWLGKEAPRGDGAAVRPLPLDASLKRKPSWAALAGSFDKARPR